MMYKNQAVSAISSNGKYLKEDGDVVTLKFDSEYEIVLKNLKGVRAIVHVDIDGKRVTNHGLVLNPNQSITLEREVSESDVGNRFKFIKMTDKIAEYRGHKVEDGLIRVEFNFEEPVALNNNFQVGLGYDALRRMLDYPLGNNYILCSSNSNSGITVPGSESYQKFQSVASFNTKEKVVMVFKLIGTDGKSVVTKDKIKCETCGTKNKSSHKYCKECGTHLGVK